MKKFTVCLEPGCLELTGDQDQEKCPKHRPSSHFCLAFNCAECGANWEYYQQLKDERDRKQEELDAYRSLGSVEDLIDKVCRLEILLHAEELQLED